MSDLDKLTALLDSFGVEYKVNTRGILDDRYSTDTNDINHTIITTEQQSAMEGVYFGVGGYQDFYTNFEFDKDGKFLSMGAWE